MNYKILAATTFAILGCSSLAEAACPVTSLTFKDAAAATQTLCFGGASGSFLPQSALVDSNNAALDTAPGTAPSHVLTVQGNAAGTNLSTNLNSWGGTATTAAAALSDAIANPTAPQFGAANEGWDTTNSVWRRRWVVPGTGINEGAATDNAGTSLYDKSAYRIAGGPVSTFAASATDWITITGSASKTVRITNITLCGIATASTSVVVQVIKRSSADSGGTSAALIPMPEDSTDAAASATAAIYTANPTTLGTAVGNHDVYYLNLNPTGSAGCFSSDNGTRNGQALVLRGVAQQMAINFAGTSLPSGASLTYRLEETEGSATD